MRHHDFQLAGGSVIGRDHRAIPKNCQDGYYIQRLPQATIAVVTDGCGSGAHNEVGAKLGARLIAESIGCELAFRPVHQLNWMRIQGDVTAVLHVLARQMGSSFSETVKEYFLFTIVGAVLAGEQAVFFALGDGLIVINDDYHTLGPFPGNQPPYLGYALLEGNLDSEMSAKPVIQVVDRLPLANLDHFLIGCDGASDLDMLSRRATRPVLPGLSTPVEPLSQFWNEDRFFENPAAVGRQLKLMARDHPGRQPSGSMVIEPGLLGDDTTLIVGRQTPVPAIEEAL